MTPNTAEYGPLPAVEDFEELARTAPETVRLEFVNGKIEVKAVPDGMHDEIVMWLSEQCMQHRPELRLYVERGLKVEKYRKGRTKSDGALAPRRHFLGDGDWSDPDGVLMVVEVPSRDRDTNQRDRIDKPDGYAAAGIPVCLLVDRDAAKVVVHTEPKDGQYDKLTAGPYGTPFELPDPVGFTLETDELKHLVG